MPVIQYRTVLQSTAIAKCSSPVVPMNDKKNGYFGESKHSPGYEC